MALLSPDQIYGLAPTEFVSRRGERFDGDNLYIELNALAPEDRAIIREIYDFAGRIMQQVPLKDETDRRSQLEVVSEFLDSFALSEFTRRVHELGVATKEQTDGYGEFRQVIHDVRGGGLTALMGKLAIVRMGILPPEELKNVHYLARDHQKIMRNGIVGLDDARRADDKSEQVHHLQQMINKWQRMHLHDAERDLLIELDCRYNGAISQRCLEFSALERALYNLLNNAIRHTADGRVELHIVPIPATPPEHVRFVVANRITPEQKKALDQQFGDQPSQLFSQQFSTTGSGLGTKICANIVMQAYGHENPRACLEQGILGVRLEDQAFVAWFHWPALNEGAI